MDTKLIVLLDRFQNAAETYGWSSDQGTGEAAADDLRAMNRSRANLERYLQTQGLDLGLTTKVRR